MINGIPIPVFGQWYRPEEILPLEPRDKDAGMDYLITDNSGIVTRATFHGKDRMWTTYVGRVVEFDIIGWMPLPTPCPRRKE